MGLTPNSLFSLVNVGDVNRGKKYGNGKERWLRMHRKLPSSVKALEITLFTNVCGAVPIQQHFQVWWYLVNVLLLLEMLTTHVDDAKSKFPAQISLSSLFCLICKSLIFSLILVPSSQYTEETCWQYYLTQICTSIIWK